MNLHGLTSAQDHCGDYCADRSLFRYLHADFVRALVVLPDGALLAGSYDGTLRRYVPMTALGRPD